MKTMLVLGIESSCDETAAAVVRDGNIILSSEIHSQVETHRAFGGVVPELASREHLARIGAVVDAALETASVDADNLEAVAVTQGPGLVGSLMVGVSYGKAFAYGLQIPCIGVNHIEGHFYSVVFENPPIEYPALALIVSGGHTNLFHVPVEGRYELVSRTRDDAAGEAFDKVAKMLGLGYPGGPLIEKLAREGDPKKARFPKAKISDGRPDFSFSGLKTAVVRHLRENNVEPVEPGRSPTQQIKDIAAGFQATVVSSLVDTLRKVARNTNPKTLIIAGGVACNLALRNSAEAVGADLGIPVYFPSKHLSTDNAAMIAAAGHAHLIRGETSPISMAADVTMRLHDRGAEDTLRSRKRVPYRL